ncbi:MAG: DUF5723 family protein [Bacteroidota bacterium]
MRKRWLTFPIFFCLLTQVSAQILPGISTSNYNGVLGTFNNPSNVLGKYKWDVHIVGVNVIGANENSKVKISDVGEDNFLTEKLIGTSGYNNANVNLEVPAISFLVGAGKKSSFAVTTRARVFANATNIDARLASALLEDETSNLYPYTILPGNASLVKVSGITDYGFTWANELMNKGQHYLKGGITIKYVSGVGNANINADVAGVINQDADGEYISPGTGTIALKAGGSTLLDDFEFNQLYNFKGGGAGFDVGFTYEFRPQGWGTATTKEGRRAHGNIPYKFKIAGSIMDLGKVKFTPDPDLSKAYDVHIASNQKFYLSAFEETSIEDVGEVFDAYPQYFTSKGAITESYKVSLPTTLRLNIDFNLGKGFFANADAQLAMKTENTMDNIQVYNSFSVTPRFEGKMLGVFLPVTFNQLSGVTIGTAFHLGPLYIGSGSIISLITGGSKQADAFFGFRFGGLK